MSHSIKTSTEKAVETVESRLKETEIDVLNKAVQQRHPHLDIHVKRNVETDEFTIHHAKVSGKILERVQRDLIITRVAFYEGVNALAGAMQDRLEFEEKGGSDE